MRQLCLAPRTSISKFVSRPCLGTWSPLLLKSKFDPKHLHSKGGREKFWWGGNTLVGNNWRGAPWYRRGNLPLQLQTHLHPKRHQRLGLKAESFFPSDVWTETASQRITCVIITRIAIRTMTMNWTAVSNFYLLWKLIELAQIQRARTLPSLLSSA